MAESTTENTSSGEILFSPMFLISRVPTARAIRTMGSIIQNSQCQVSEFRMKPETVGPRAGATEITMEMIPIIAPRRCAGTTVKVTVISSGITNAVPTAWMMRPISKMAKLGARAATRVPTVKNNCAVTKMVLVLKRSNRKPVVGMTTAMVSMNPVVNHCAVVSGTWKSAMIDGNATDRIVSLRIMIIAEMTRMERTTTTSRGSLSCSGEVCLFTWVSIKEGKDLSKQNIQQAGHLLNGRKTPPSCHNTPTYTKQSFSLPHREHAAICAMSFPVIDIDDALSS